MELLNTTILHYLTEIGRALCICTYAITGDNQYNCALTQWSIRQNVFQLGVFQSLKA